MIFNDIITLIFVNQNHLVFEYPIKVRDRLRRKSNVNTLTAFDTVKEILYLSPCVIL